MPVTQDNLKRFFAKRKIKIDHIEALGRGYVVVCNDPQSASRIWMQTAETDQISFCHGTPWWRRLWRRLRGG